MNSLEWKASRSNVLAPTAFSGTYVLFNALSGALLELGENTHELLHAWIDCSGPVPAHIPASLTHALSADGFIVPADFDENLTLARLHANRQSSSLVLTVAPTMQCNFRCSYCFESHRHSFMNAKVQEQLKVYIAAQLRQLSNVSITWFGGEPLLHVSCIENVQSFVDDSAAKLGIPSSRQLVTNGFLMNDGVLRRLRALGDWRQIQVTIDGDASTHDSRRHLVGGQGTFSTILANCLTALEMGFPLSIRVNVDSRNRDAPIRLLDDLEQCGIAGRSSIYLGCVEASTAECAATAQHVLSRQEFSAIRLAFQAELMRRGFRSGARIPKPQCGVLCTADNPHGFVVNPDGYLYKCWNEVHAPAEVAVGHLDQATVVPHAISNAKLWASYDPLNKSACKSCSAAAACMGGCAWENRLETGDHGHCGQFKFFPRETLALAHYDLTRRTSRTTRG